MSRPSRSSISIHELEQHASTCLERVAESGAPLVIIEAGRPAGVLLSMEAYSELTERSRFVAAIDEGLADSKAGRVHSHDDVVAAMKKRLGDLAAR